MPDCLFELESAREPRRRIGLQGDRIKRVNGAATLSRYAAGSVSGTASI